MTKTFISLAVGSLLLATTALSSAHADDFAEAMTSAYKTNPRIHTQRRALEQVNENVSQAIAAFRPNVTATFQTGRQRVKFDDLRDVGDVENRTLSVTQPIFLGGSNIFNYHASKERLYAARQQLVAIEQEVLLDAVTAYLDVVRDFQVHELSVSNHNVLARQLKSARDRFSVGDVTRTDVAQSETRAARADTDVIQAKGNLESAIATFERVVGFNPENLPLPFPQEVPEMPATLKEAIDIAIHNSPNLLFTHHNKEAADDDANVALASILPQVSLQGSISRQDGAGSTGTSQLDQDRILLNVNIPIYQNGSEYAQVRSANLLAKQREFEMQDAREEVTESTQRAWEAMQTAKAVITSQQVQVASAQTALDGVRQEHQYGSRTVLDVLDAEQELFSANVDLAQAKRNYLVSVYNLKLIMGELYPQLLGVDAPTYDASEHYDSVKWQLLGF